MSITTMTRWVAVAIAAFLVHASMARTDSADPSDATLDRQTNVIEAVGVIRYFHPHDAGTVVDWNRVLLEGFELAERSADDETFAKALSDLLAETGSGIRQIESDEFADRTSPLECESGEAPQRWVHRGVGAAPAVGQQGIYTSRRSGAQARPEIGPDAFSNVMTHFPAEPWLGRRLVFTSEARVTNGGTGAMWIRVTDSNGKILVFDNMVRRKISNEDWEPVSVEFAVPEKSETIAVGMLSHGASRVQFRDIDLREADRQSDQPLGSSILPALDQWQTSSPDGIQDPEVAATVEDELVTLTPGTERLPPVDDTTMALFDDAPTSWVVGLVDGTALRIPLALCADDAAADERSTARLEARFPEADPSDLTVAERARLDVATVWPVIQHFYPYRDQLDDWPGALEAALNDSRSASDPEAHRQLLQRLMVRINDGHTRVHESREQEESVGWLPVSIVSVDGDLVVASTASAGRVAAGDRITAIDGESTARWLERTRSHYSGSDHWRTHRAIYRLMRGAPGSARVLGLARESESFEAELPFELEGPMEPFDHPATRTLDGGAIYVNLTKIDEQQWTDRLPELAEAPGIVFDLRGYPGALGTAFLGNLLESRDDFTGWMQILLARSPDGDLTMASEHAWEIPPAEPRIRAPVVFLTNQRAISYSESLLGLIRHNELGPIVGSNTAGANGNVLPLMLPGGFTVSYTGMRVIGPDGAPFHARGIEPDVRAAPTVEGLRAGRDEVLERGLEWLRKRQSALRKPDRAQAQ